MRITAWRGFLTAGLVATAGYYLLPDSERVAAASSLDQKLTSIVLPLPTWSCWPSWCGSGAGAASARPPTGCSGWRWSPLLAADAAFGVVILRGPFSPGGPIDAGHSLFLVGCGAAALHPSMAQLAVAGPPVAARRPRGRLALLGAAAILADQETARLRVRDDGVGFDASNRAQLLARATSAWPGCGERASLVGGSLEVGSMPGHGTTVEVRANTAEQVDHLLAVLEELDDRFGFRRPTPEAVAPLPTAFAPLTRLSNTSSIS